jgi:hypothetical protein
MSTKSPATVFATPVPNNAKATKLKKAAHTTHKGAAYPGEQAPIVSRELWLDVRPELPMSLSVEPMHDDPSLKAFVYGPLVLAGLLGQDGMATIAPYAGRDQLQYKAVPDPAVPSLLMPTGDVSNCLTQTGTLELLPSHLDRIHRFALFHSRQ